MTTMVLPGIEGMVGGQERRRRRRSDAGTHKWMPQDGERLRFIGEQGVVQFDQLVQLVGEGESRARTAQRRWMRAGWVAGRVLLPKEPAFVWLTQAGMDVAGLPYEPWTVNYRTLHHEQAIVEVRLKLQETNPAASWICERELRYQQEEAIRLAQEQKDEEQVKKMRRAHRPDAVIEQDGVQAAIEVELTAKSKERWLQIIDELLERYGTVWYMAGPEVLGPLTTLVETRQAEGAKGWKKVMVYLLPQRRG